MRELVAETRLSVNDVVAPLFVREGVDQPQPIASLPGVVQHSLASLETEIAELIDLGVRGVVLFGVPLAKDPIGSGAFDPNGIVQVKAALAQATAGAHVVAPSGMMDGQVAAIRAGLDGGGFGETAIMGYSAKYASALYGPFRDAVDVQIAGGGNRKGYQQDWRNAREALIEVAADIEQGADIVMVKPAVAYLDVIAAVRAMTDLPLAAYHVSGEYSMLKAAAANGWIDHDTVALEHLTAIKRAGADFILTYLAHWFAETAR
jgi:porphobilinogen synthase